MKYEMSWLVLRSVLDMYLLKSGTLRVSTLDWKGFEAEASPRAALLVLNAATRVVERRADEEDRASERVAVERDAIVFCVFLLAFFSEMNKEN